MKTFDEEQLKRAKKFLIENNSLERFEQNSGMTWLAFTCWFVELEYEMYKRVYEIDLIKISFDWENTPEGKEYWERLDNKWRKKFNKKREWND